MLTRRDFEDAQGRAAALIQQAGIRISPAEADRVEVADFGLSRLPLEGVQILTFFQTERVAAKVLALFPGQTEPEHWHPAVGADPGKEETIRVVTGTVYFCVPGEDTLRTGRVPEGKDACYTCRHELILRACDQLTLVPGTKHWFQAGPEGAVMYTFSTCAHDVLDQFTDPAIVRMTRIVD